MRYAIILGRQHGQTAFAAVGESGAPKEIGQEFKRLCAAPGDFAELHLLTSDVGATKRKLFGSQASVAIEDAQTDQSQEGSEQTSTPTGVPAEASSAEEAPAEAADLGPTLPGEGESLAESDEAPAKSRKGK